MLPRFSNKSLQWIFTLFLSFALSACFVSTTTSPPLINATVQPTSIQLPTSTEDLPTQKQKIWDEVSREVTEFNQLVEQEKSLGKIETGQDFFRFTGESDIKIRAAHENLMSQIVILRDRYLALYKQDYNPTPFPTFSIKEEALDFYYQTMQENQDWLEAQEKTESALRIYDPDRGNYVSFLSFDQDIWLGLRNEALNKLRMEAELSPELLANHKAIVEKLDSVPVEANEITSLPYYRNDLTLFQYRTRKNYYVLNADGAVIEITPVQGASTTGLTLPAQLTTDQLEDNARSFINLIAPGTNLDALTLDVGLKTSNSFFKWEDRTKPALDGGGFPYIQVAINLDGEMLNYINTLPLSR